MSGDISAVIIGTGSYAPPKVLSNQDFEKMVETSDEWIVQRTGIKERRQAGPDESASTMGVHAAKAAIENAGLTPDDIDLVICGTFTGDMQLPSTASLIQRDLGMTDTPAFDVGAACSGFIYSLSAGVNFIKAGMYKRVLVVASDCNTKFTDYQDRGSCILFGDAAGAVVLEAQQGTDKGVKYCVMGADGQGWDYIHIPAGGSACPASAETVADRRHYIQLRGREVYKFAVGKMTFLMDDCMKQCGLSVDDVDLVVPHQVNMRIIESATGKLKFPLEKVFVNIERYGNTSAASAAFALDEARRSGKITEGSTILMAAFGAGLTWAGATIQF